MIYFLASMPRSGSTLLASLLGQRKDTYVSPTSNLGEMMGGVVQSWEQNPATKAGECSKDELYRTLNGLMIAKYADRDEPIIFDKGRGWPEPTIMTTMEKVTGGPIKIIATVRPIAECIASFYEIDKSKLAVKQWIKTSELFTHLMMSYYFLNDGYEKYPDQFCLVDYDDLVNHTQRELDRVCDFVGIDRFIYSNSIEQVEENDNAWNIKDLHKLESKIEPNKNNAREILGDTVFEYYQGGEFWNDKPDPVKGNKPLDLSLEAGLLGKFDKAYDILKREEQINPEDNRVGFNLGWYEMRRGNYHKGHKLLVRGREEEVFGNKHIGTKQPCWDGQRGVNVLIEMEGGFGDQIHAIRYAKKVRDYGNNVVISGCMPLAPIFRQIEGVTAIVQHEAALGVYHDYWLPAMSASVPFEEEYSDLDGSAYIPRLCKSERKVGVKWAGNPEFEHEQHRFFPSELMFDAVNDEDCISLQYVPIQTCERGHGDPAPEWMEKPSLETWLDTQMAISRCDLVITSCTGVAHLAGAMGIETWILVPILPYYLWALPGNKTPHYDSVTLYRQVKARNWDAPFKQIKKDLIQRRAKKLQNYAT